MAAFAQGLDADQPVLGRIQTPQGDVLQAQALDGKTLRGASAYGETTHLVSVVRGGLPGASATVLGQQRVASKIDERQAAHQLLTAEMLVAQ